MITLLGIGHVFDIGRATRDAILSRRPKVVALELDPARYAALVQRAPRSRGFGVLHLVAGIEARVAAEYGVQVGDEMLAAARAANEVGAEVALVDVDSRDVLVRMWRSMSWGEKTRLVVSLVRGMFAGREQVETELARYHQDERSVIDEFARALPTAKRILIDERDAHMAARLADLHRTRGDVVAVVGDGHIHGLRDRLAAESLEVVRLRDLRSPPSGPNASASVSVRL